MRSRTAINILLSLLLAALFLYLAAHNVSLEQLRQSFRRFDARWLVPAVALSLLLQVFRAWRWQLELLPLARIPFARLWIVTSIAYMAINLLPARLGEFVRPWLLSRRAKVSFSNVVGNLLLEKTMDSLAIVFYILVGLLSTENLPYWVRRGAIFPAVGAGALVALVLLLWWRGEAFVRRTVVRHLPERFGAALMRVLGALVAGMQILPRPRLVAAVFFLSLALWFIPILSSYVMIVAFGFDAPFSAALIVFIFIGFGTALPQAPGMIGAYQYACVLALGLFGVAEADALAYGIVLNALQLLTLVGQGLVALVLSGISVEEIARGRVHALAD
jgi:uncharacterized protein (TIRG00374 family)